MVQAEPRAKPLCETQVGADADPPSGLGVLDERPLGVSDEVRVAVGGDLRAVPVQAGRQVRGPPVHAAEAPARRHVEPLRARVDRVGPERHGIHGPTLELRAGPKPVARIQALCQGDRVLDGDPVVVRRHQQAGVVGIDESAREADRCLVAQRTGPEVGARDRIALGQESGAHQTLAAAHETDRVEAALRKSRCAEAGGDRGAERGARCAQLHAARQLAGQRTSGIRIVLETKGATQRPPARRAQLHVRIRPDAVPILLAQPGRGRAVAGVALYPAACVRRPVVLVMGGRKAAGRIARSTRPRGPVARFHPVRVSPEGSADGQKRRRGTHLEFPRRVGVQRPLAHVEPAAERVSGSGVGSDGGSVGPGVPRQELGRVRRVDRIRRAEGKPAVPEPETEISRPLAHVAAQPRHRGLVHEVRLLDGEEAIRVDIADRARHPVRLAVQAVRDRFAS